MRAAGVLVAVLATASVASAALAKGDVVARLDRPAALHAPAGTIVSVSWTLRDGARPFGASGIYLRLRGDRGHTTIADATQTSPGRFRARIRIPHSGVRSGQVGLRGWRTYAGRTTRADMHFRIVNLKPQ